MNTNKLAESIDSIKKFQFNLNEAAEHTQDVKDGVSTPEEERQEPDYILFNHIAESTINILQLPSIEKAFDSIAEKLDEDTAQHLAEMIALSMVHSAYDAVAFYDGLLKKELDKQFNHFADKINEIDSVVTAHNGALQVCQEKLGIIEKNIKINSLLNQ